MRCCRPCIGDALPGVKKVKCSVRWRTVACPLGAKSNLYGNGQNRPAGACCRTAEREIAPLWSFAICAISLRSEKH